MVAASCETRTTTPTKAVPKYTTTPGLLQPPADEKVSSAVAFALADEIRVSRGLPTCDQNKSLDVDLGRRLRRGARADAEHPLGVGGKVAARAGTSGPPRIIRSTGR